MFIAAKYEEVYPPVMDDFVKVCDNLYPKRDIIKMEMSILKALEFELGRPLPLHFLRRFSKAAHADTVIHNIAKYLMELCLMEYQCAHWNPSLVAATALYISLKIVDSANKWTDTLVYYSQYTEEQLKPHVTTLCNIIIKTPSSKLQVSALQSHSSRSKNFFVHRIVERSIHPPNLIELAKEKNWNRHYSLTWLMEDFQLRPNPLNHHLPPISSNVRSQLAVLSNFLNL